MQARPSKLVQQACMLASLRYTHQQWTRRCHMWQTVGWNAAGPPHRKSGPSLRRWFYALRLLRLARVFRLLKGAPPLLLLVANLSVAAFAMHEHLPQVCMSLKHH